MSKSKLRNTILLIMVSVLLFSNLCLITGAQAAEYDNSAVYTAGNTTIYNGVTYQVRWQTQVTAPDVADSAWQHPQQLLQQLRQHKKQPYRWVYPHGTRNGMLFRLHSQL